MTGWLRHAKGYVLTAIMVLILTLLFIVALARLSEIQKDMRNNVSTNMLWVITQSQAEGLALSGAIHAYSAGNLSAQQLEKQHGLFQSRLNLMLAGPQSRYLNQYALFDGLSDLLQQALAIETLLTSVINNPNDGQQIHALLNPLNARLRQAANQAMVIQWEETGARLDRYRDAVLVAILLMVGIWVCSLLISVRMFLALKRVNEAQEAKREASRLTTELYAQRKVNELHRNFGAMVSHQFRTPLAIIDASMQRLLRLGDNVSSEEIARRVSKVRRATQRLTRLIDNTLIADQYVDAVHVKLEPCDLGTVVREICEFQRTIAPDHFIDVDIQTVAQVCCDPALVEHIVFNFLSNAVKYSPAASLIKVQVFQENSWVCCSVSDQGKGVEQDQLNHVFERYFRADNVATIQGTGIGLYVARKLALLQQGQVMANSAPGKGSVFTLYLPMA